jgi:hypothetical protein
MQYSATSTMADDYNALTSLIENRIDGSKEKVGNNFHASLERNLRLTLGTCTHYACLLSSEKK